MGGAAEPTGAVAGIGSSTKRRRQNRKKYENAHQSGFAVAVQEPEETYFPGRKPDG